MRITICQRADGYHGSEIPGGFNNVRDVTRGPRGVLITLKMTMHYVIFIMGLGIQQYMTMHGMLTNETFVSVMLMTVFLTRGYFTRMLYSW